MIERLSERAAILTEAMPYLRRYAGKIVVIKLGGHAMVNEDVALGFSKDVVLLQQCGLRIVIVHGGGPQIGQLMAKLDVKTSFIDGLRYTDAPTMEIAEMVLAGQINKGIVANIQQADGRAVGISGKDGRLVEATRRTHNSRGEACDYGLVGDPNHINIDLIHHLLEGDFIPVIAPIGIGADGESLNINSDTVAGAIAAALSAKRLLLLSDTPGILDQNGQPIPALDLDAAEGLLSDGTVSGGMIPKITICIEAVRSGLEAAVVLDGRDNHAALIELLSDKGYGTLIARKHP